MAKTSLTEKMDSEIEALERTIRILEVVEKEHPIGITKLSKRLDIQEHRVRASLRMLERENLIKPTARGAVLTDDYGKFKDDLCSHLKNLNETIVDLRQKIEA